jgi:hypothetical protein
MIEAIRAIALSCGEDLVQQLRDLADELEAKKIKPRAGTKKATKKSPQKKVVVEEVKAPSKNKWNPKDYARDVPREKQPLTKIEPRVRPKANLVNVKCSFCPKNMKVSEELVRQSEVSSKPFRCDKCIAKGL